MIDDSGKFKVPEPPAQLKRGFLSEYWQEKTPPPMLSGRQALVYFLGRGLATLAEVPINTVVTITSVTCSLVIIGVFLLAYQNLGRSINDAGESYSVSYFLKEAAEESAVKELLRSFEERPDVLLSQYISREQALNRLKQGLGDRSDLLSGLEEDNPLPASIEVSFNRDKISQVEIAAVTEKILGSTGLVQEVLIGNEWVAKFGKTLQAFKLFGLFGFFATLLIVGALIANTIRLVFYSQRELIGIMRLVGASEQFVRLPFVIGGVIQGFVGGLFSLLVLTALVTALQSSLGDLSSFGLLVPEISHLGTLNMCLIPTLGTIVGAVASWISVSKYLAT
jgi:cell division transport system permease protein